MTLRETMRALEEVFNNTSEDDDQEEYPVYFDFPLVPGQPNKFKVTQINKRGIMVKNETIQRPLGHE